jgi:hypothetical protein
LCAVTHSGNSTQPSDPLVEHCQTSLQNLSIPSVFCRVELL